MNIQTNLYPLPIQAVAPVEWLDSFRILNVLGSRKNGFDYSSSLIFYDYFLMSFRATPIQNPQRREPAT